MSHEWTIRAELKQDFNSIDEVILAASEGEREAVEIVHGLRRDGQVLCALVAEIESRIVGHIMMSRMMVETPTTRIPAVALAPLMVEPAFQNRGIGSDLTLSALAHCRDAGERVVFVLGHPTYYSRFGFSAEMTRDFDIPFRLERPGPFMALELKAGALRGVRGKVRYPTAFLLPAQWTMCPPRTSD
jgi:putative acetyltransferase